MAFLKLTLKLICYSCFAFVMFKLGYSVTSITYWVALVGLMCFDIYVSIDD